mmetsp:Transcript_1351/g.2832  ORF Transcript_1351/g.2832 Transcript_1351/m.2832 type:complete len:206 (+) Transcript_1351:750-1367(+)
MPRVLFRLAHDTDLSLALFVVAAGGFHLFEDRGIGSPRTHRRWIPRGSCQEIPRRETTAPGRIPFDGIPFGRRGKGANTPPKAEHRGSYLPRGRGSPCQRCRGGLSAKAAAAATPEGRKADLFVREAPGLSRGGRRLLPRTAAATAIQHKRSFFLETNIARSAGGNGRGVDTCVCLVSKVDYNYNCCYCLCCQCYPSPGSGHSKA